MKYIKKAPLVRNNPKSDKFSVTEDDNIITTTHRGMELPRGGNVDRPGTYVDGTVRFNTDLGDPEIYNGTTGGLGWEKIRTVRPAPITVQTLGPGNYVTFDFGPLQYSTGEYYTDYQHPQNIFVFVENVFQIPNTNYTLIQNGSRVYVRFSADTEGNGPPLGKFITVYLGYDGYFPPFPAP